MQLLGTVFLSALHKPALTKKYNGDRLMAGSAILLQRGNYRRQFADFLDRLASGSAQREEWSSFVVTQYPDEFLDEMRRCTVRLGCGYLPQAIDSDEGRQMLRAWAIAIRSSVPEDAVPVAAREA